MEHQAVLCLMIFALVIIGFLIQKISLAQTAMMGMLLMIWTGCLEPNVALANFATPSIMLMCGTFLMAGAFGKTQTVTKIARFMSVISKGEPRRITACYVILALLTNELIGNSVAAFGVIWPLALASCKEMQISPSKLAFPIAITCIAGSGFLPSTASVSMAEFYRQYFIQFGMEQYANYSVFDYMAVRTPISITVVLYAIFLAPKFAPERIDGFGLMEEKEKDDGENRKGLSTAQEWITVATFLGMILGIAFSGRLGLVGWQFSITAAMVILAAKVLQGKEIYANMGISVICLIGAGANIASALQQSGAAELIGKFMLGIFGVHPNGYVFGAAFFLICFVLTQVMSNMAVNQIFVPICLMTCSAIGCNPFGPVFLSISGTLTSFMTPVGDPVTVMMFDAGGYTIKDSVKMGWFMVVIMFAVSVTCTMTLYPMY